MDWLLSSLGTTEYKLDDSHRLLMAVRAEEMLRGGVRLTRQEWMDLSPESKDAFHSALDKITREYMKDLAELVALQMENGAGE